MHLGFALEHSLGHVTHAMNLKRVVQHDTAIRPTYVDLPFDRTPGFWSQLPGVRSNWSVRASLGAYLGLRSCARSLEGALFHTQVTSLFSTALMARVPSVISLDATPLQYDRLGAFYGHKRGNERIEKIKKKMNERAFAAARHLVTWSQWAKDSLVRDYGVSAHRVTVIPPGIDTDRWRFPRERREGPVNFLFVGADFYRKGGETLLQAFRRLPKALDLQLHIVTRTESIGEDLPNVTVYRGVPPNSEVLLRRFSAADVFVFPTRGDCLPLAVMEALASGLPVITTQIAALPEAVAHQESGWIVPPDDSVALSEAMTALASNADLRQRMGERARETALERFSAGHNYRRLVQVIKNLASA